MEDDFPKLSLEKKGELLLLLRILAMKQICCQILLNSTKMKVGFEIWHISDFTRLIIPLTKHRLLVGIFVQKVFETNINLKY